MATEFIWHSDDRTTEIHLSLEVVDGILHECMRGLGAVPKRGAEVGGVLLGSVARVGSTRRVTVDGFEAVPIEYRHGPSYLFSLDDARLFEETMARLSGGAGPQPAGFFRANTREEMELTADDVNTLKQHFGGADSVALLIRPYTTKLSMAGFVLPRDGRFVAGTAPSDEIPFRRRELEEMLEAQTAPAGPRVPYRPFALPVPPHAPVPAPVPTPASAPAPASAPVTAAVRASAGQPQPQPPTPAAPPITRKRRVHWTWVPLSSIFLAVGILLGIQATLSMRGVSSDPYDLKLSLSKAANTLTLSWDRHAPAIRAARRGTVSIEDGEVKTTRDLEASELRTGSIVYAPATTSVHFRLQVFPRERDSITETIDWSQ
ncbi:MAG: hypothetical protein ABSF98_16090 [Bryobacteraceae bacterium]|jgi:hypothetical protein